MTPAKRWGNELTAVMQARQIPCKALAAAMGKSMSSVSQARSGQYLPSVAQAAQYAEALLAPHLQELCADLRKKRCEVCGRMFVEDHHGGLRQFWCSESCKHVGRARARAGKTATDTKLRYDLWQRRAKQRQTLIDRMCWTCEPEGGCRDGRCPLRPASPLPLVDVRDVGVAEKGSVRLDAADPRRRKRQQERQREWLRSRRAAS